MTLLPKSRIMDKNLTPLARDLEQMTNKPPWLQFLICNLLLTEPKAIYCYFVVILVKN